MEALDARISASKRSHDTDGPVSSNSVARKRRRRRNTALRDVRDFVPSGGSFKSNTASLDDAGDQELGPDSASHKSVGAAAGANWNTGTKATIRTSIERKQVGG